MVHPGEVGGDEDVGRGALLDLFGEGGRRGIGDGDGLAGLGGPGGVDLVEGGLERGGGEDGRAGRLGGGRSRGEAEGEKGGGEAGGQWLHARYSRGARRRAAAPGDRRPRATVGSILPRGFAKFKRYVIEFPIDEIPCIRQCLFIDIDIDGASRFVMNATFCVFVRRFQSPLSRLPGYRKLYRQMNSDDRRQIVQHDRGIAATSCGARPLLPRWGEGRAFVTRRRGSWRGGLRRR